jgi:hypothetical protein
MSKKRTRKTKKKRRYVENLKEKFRKSPEWKEFRSHVATLFDHKDPITGKKLTKGYNVHHMRTNQDPENYCNITNESEFIPLNSYSHKLLPYLFGYYKKDKSILCRLQDILDKMCELNMDAPVQQNQTQQ